VSLTASCWLNSSHFFLIACKVFKNAERMLIGHFERHRRRGSEPPALL
jgi:hypothetical protein